MHATGQKFTIAIYNIFDGRSSEKVINTILSLIESGVSVICLQEVWFQYRNKSMSKLIDERLPLHFRSHYFLGQETSEYSYGLGTLWNTHVFSEASFEKLSLPLKTHLTLWDKMFFWTLRMKPKIFERGALIGNFAVGQNKIRITNLHLDFQGGDDHRIKQLALVKERLALQSAVDHEIICGDFNTVGLLQKKQKIAELEKLMGDGFKSVLNKPYSSSIIQQLDYIFVKNLKVGDARLLHVRGSDHFPLLAQLETE